MMISIIEELKELMEEKKISPETSAFFLGCTGRQIRRWIEGDAIPNLTSRKKIRKGMKKIRRDL